MVETRDETYQQWRERIGALGIPQDLLRIDGYRAGRMVWAKATNLATGELVGEWSDPPSPKEPGE